MEITGRLTRDAQVRTTQTDKEVVGFTIAINDSYRKKGATEVTQLVTYIDCSYRRSAAIATYLTKGTIVQLSGRLNEPRIWQDMEGTPRANLSFTVGEIKILGGGTKSNGGSTQETKLTKDSKAAQAVAVPTDAVADDLPF
ncbi:single-stranded DNA-binding protein [Rhizosphaericola mali]|uniref:Single-stranded DNA-binding protein n=1 Tax=Rhizosphaericola mali TaxID=2545455 RepID=A0A5P2GBJ8_9BACT|nr:single-stranded DNA-binding protein [Rhizosphaericola mali]QES88941.1 single-stranded DNA-binding protein [Rhizosphaericola mali]